MRGFHPVNVSYFVCRSHKYLGLNVKMEESIVCQQSYVVYPVHLLIIHGIRHDCAGSLRQLCCVLPYVWSLLADPPAGGNYFETKRVFFYSWPPPFFVLLIVPLLGAIVSRTKC